MNCPKDQRHSSLGQSDTSTLASPGGNLVQVWPSPRPACMKSTIDSIQINFKSHYSIPLTIPFFNNNNNNTRRTTQTRGKRTTRERGGRRRGRVRGDDDEDEGGGGRRKREGYIRQSITEQARIMQYGVRCTVLDIESIIRIRAGRAWHVRVVS
ncbi:hypothetical protein DENSPDRAFT_285968 [Dentipellis sp. KUC8613]|nr:hypothetical protein DENSPDRAFT_285968 [Dentipellis sp. KUC8613]